MVEFSRSRSHKSFLAQIYSHFLKEQKNNGHIKGLAYKKVRINLHQKSLMRLTPGENPITLTKFF